MLKTKISISIFLSLLAHCSVSQTLEFSGQVNANSDLEGIHVLNKTSKYYSITNKKGAFTIKGRLNDTVVFSSVLYKIESIKISKENLLSRTIYVKLQEYVNILDEVYIGNALSGNLNDDIKNMSGKPKINFYDVGIPGYKGKPKTKRERELYEADHGKFVNFYGIGFSINFYKILNRISGRTKKLKNRVRLEKRDELMYRLKAKFAKDLFKGSELSQEKQMDFFYYCSEDSDFLKEGSLSNEIEVLLYLQEKLKVYKSNINNFDE